MSITIKPLTVEELEQIPNDGNRYEIVGGELYMSAAPDRRHQEALSELNEVFQAAARHAKSGKVFFAPVDVRFANDTQVQPDLIYIRTERLSIYRGHVVFGPPDVVAEMLSPSSRVADQTVKFRLFESGGVLEYWLGDPERRELRLYVLRGGRYEEIAAEAGRLRSTVIPGLEVDVAGLFAAAFD
ncbi:MAG: Uma2 family endonuclease [Thermomicrobiales bacterium]